MDVPRGRVLGVDVGSVRTGLALGDPDGLIASPLTTLAVAGDPAGEDVVGSVAAAAAEHSVVEIVVGWPVGLSGRAGPAARTAEAFAARLADAVRIPVRLVDERFTTTSATSVLREAGRTGRRARSNRAVVDQVAAVVLLQHVLDARRSGVRVGSEPAREGVA